jgi:hypothetical protein
MVLSLVMVTTVSAQSQQPPKEEYLLITSSSSLVVTRGQPDSLRLTVLRSKSFKTGKSTIAFNAPKDAALDVTVKQHVTNPDEYTVFLKTTENSKPGEYNFVPTCTLRNKNKGIVLKLIIN